MADTKKTQRFMNKAAEIHWNEAIEKEKNLRMKWFLNNEQRIQSQIDNKEEGTDIDQLKETVKEETEKIFKAYTRAPKLKFEEKVEPVEGIYLSNMKPVDPKVKNIIYTSTQKDGRVRYLKDRYKLSPECRFYNPETDNSVYGWNIANYSSGDVRYGKVQIIKQSFYRRRAGVTTDPDWYRSPAAMTPTVCGVI